MLDAVHACIPTDTALALLRSAVGCVDGGVGANRVTIDPETLARFAHDCLFGADTLAALQTVWDAAVGEDGHTVELWTDDARDQRRLYALAATLVLAAYARGRHLVVRLPPESLGSPGSVSLTVYAFLARALAGQRNMTAVELVNLLKTVRTETQ